MTDDDRLADYFARLETPDYRRTLVDGCTTCQHSLVYCRCITYIEGDGARCCGSCSGH